MPIGDKSEVRTVSGQERVIRVFISSTFRDMHAERDHLVTVVFPALSERLERLGLEFFDVDLRWGVPSKGADGEIANSWEYCKKRIDEVEPFFIGILGQRYGWMPSPLEIKDDVDRTRYAGLSVTEMEIRHAVLSGEVSRRSYFYFRGTPVPKIEPADVYDEFVDTAHEKSLNDLRMAIRNTSGRPVRDYNCHWTGAGFSDLGAFGRMVLEDLWHGVLRDERCVSKDVWRQALNADPDSNPRYTDESLPIPENLCDRIVALAKPEPKDPLDARRAQNEAFAASRLRRFQGRSRELEQLTDFVSSTDPSAERLAIVTGPPGQGKSALLAQLHEQLKTTPHLVVTHFVGATERSATAYGLVARLLDELDRAGIAWPTDEKGESEPKRDFSSLRRRLALRLGDYAGARRVVIVLDALNQLSDGHDLHWLPIRVGSGVRVIASCVADPMAKADSPELRVERALGPRKSNCLTVTLGELTDDDVRAVAVAYLAEYCHELDTEHVQTLCSIPQAHNPLYLMVMLNELRTLGGNDLNRVVPEKIASMAREHPTTVSLFRWVLRRLEEAEGFGRDAVQWWCLYLAHGRVGMASKELADLLSSKLGAATAATALRIERGLRRYLQRRGPQLDFFHSQLRQAVLEQYGANAKEADAHSDIATYFQHEAKVENAQVWKQSARLLGELPYHLARAGRDDELRKILSRLAFLAARVATGQVHEQVADYGLVRSPLPSVLATWRDFLQKHAQRLMQHPSTLVALVNHEGFHEAHAQVAALVWPHPWLRTSPEPIPVPDQNGDPGLNVQVTGNIDFPWHRPSAIASDRSIAFCLERLGVIRVVDLAEMRMTDVMLSVGRARPLVLACAPDAASLVVLYETGMAALYRCVSGPTDMPADLEMVAEYHFHPPETELPIVVWHDGAFWYQAAETTLAAVSVENPREVEISLPVGRHAELAALVFNDDARFVAIRQGLDTLIITSGAPIHRRRAAHLTSACACGERRVAAAFTDGALVVFGLGDTLTIQSEVRVGLIRGALGWDGVRLLWTSENSGLKAWSADDPCPQSVKDNEEVLPRHLHVLPRNWIERPDGSLLLGTTHSLSAFRISRGRQDGAGRLEEIFGGPNWRAIRKNEQDEWLLEKQRPQELLHIREVMGRTSRAFDGKGLFFAASGPGIGLVFQLSTSYSTALRDCPPGINGAVGEDSGGCWFTDRRGDIYFAEMTGQCICAARIGLRDINGSQLINCGDFLVWVGHSSKYFPETGNEPARTFVFFRKTLGSTPLLERIGEQFRHPSEGMFLVARFDRITNRLVTLWVNPSDGMQVFSVKIGHLPEFARWEFQQIPLTGLGEGTFVQADLSANGKFLGVVNRPGEMSCVSLSDGHVLATLVGSAPFTAVAHGPVGAEFWLIEAGAAIYKCTLIGGTGS